MSQTKTKCPSRKTRSAYSTASRCRPASFFNPVIQPRLRINQPGDAHEQQAEAVADSVMQSPRGHEQGTAFFKPAITPVGNSARLAGEQDSKSGATDTLAVNPATESYLGSIAGGRSLNTTERSFFESRLGYDFSKVRVHTDSAANESANSMNALAYTNGNNIVFGTGQYRPGTAEGTKLLAHELTHVVQQSGSGNVQTKLIQRHTGCSNAKDTIVDDDHDRAREMLSKAIDTISSYDGSKPTKVHDALDTHFNGSTSNAFATWINANLRILWGLTWMAGYECFTGGILERGWACRGSDLATTFWCVPGVAIRLCPRYFKKSDAERSSTMIHEWVHKYGCNFDLGYEHESDYGDNSTLTQLINADSFQNLIRDVQ